ncbi:MAG: hypothetical protein FJZ08_05425, partial [Candidatus Omnitrophica bacterium]|nr:hypothetical protein [Candidatus Omnitrophota bacterium]
MRKNGVEVEARPVVMAGGTRIGTDFEINYRYATHNFTAITQLLAGIISLVIFKLRVAKGFFRAFALAYKAACFKLAKQNGIRGAPVVRHILAFFYPLANSRSKRTEDYGIELNTQIDLHEQGKTEIEGLRLQFKGFIQAQTPTVAGKSALINKGDQQSLTSGMTPAGAFIKKNGRAIICVVVPALVIIFGLALPQLLILLGAGAVSFIGVTQIAAVGGVLITVPTLFGSTITASALIAVVLIAGIAWLVITLRSIRNQNSSLTPGTSMRGKSTAEKLTLRYDSSHDYASQSRYSSGKFSLKDNFNWLSRHKVVAIILLVVVAATAYILFPVWYAALVGVIISQFLPYLVSLFGKFFIDKPLANAGKSTFVRDAKNGQAMDKSGVMKAYDNAARVDYFQSCYDNASWLGKRYYEFQAFVFTATVRMPILMGILQFAITRALFAIIGLCVADVAIALLSSVGFTFLSSSIFDLMGGLVAVENIFNFFNLPYTVAGLTRIMFMTISLSFLNKAGIEDALRQALFGLKNGRNDKAVAKSMVDIDSLYFTLDKKTDKAGLNQIARALSLGILGNLFSGMLGKTQALREKLEDLNIDIPVSSKGEKFLAFLRYRLLASALTFTYIILQPVASLFLIPGYIIASFSKGARENPYFSLFLSTGKNFITGFFSMWVIGGEMGIVMKLGTLLPVAVIPMLALEGNTGAISWGSQMLGFLQNLTGFNPGQQIYQILGGEGYLEDRTMLINLATQGLVDPRIAELILEHSDELAQGDLAADRALEEILNEAVPGAVA